MQIDELLEAVEHSRQLIVPDTWAQGRTVFGGLSAALLNRAMVNEMHHARTIRVQNTQFIGPLLANQPLDIELVHLRDGKNVTQLQASLIQNGQVSVQATAAFGQNRESKIAEQAQPVSLASPPKKPTWIPQIPKITPKFHRYVDLRFDSGLPFTGKKASHIHGWMRFSKPPEIMTDAHLIALVDVWPSTVLQQLRMPVPASTLSWNLEFIHPQPALSGSQWLALQTETVQAAHGYVHTDGRIYTQDGTLLALSRQLDTVFG